MPIDSVFDFMSEKTAAVVARPLMQTVEECIVSAMYLWAGATVASTPETVRYARAVVLHRKEGEHGHDRGRPRSAKAVQGKIAPTQESRFIDGGIRKENAEEV